VSSDGDFGTSLGPLDTEAGQHELLQSIVELARSVFGAKACSIMRFDEATDELVFAVQAARRGQALNDAGGVGGATLAGIARALDSADGPRREAALALLGALETLLESAP